MSRGKDRSAGIFKPTPQTLLIPTCCLHCSSFLGLPFGILNIELVKPQKGTTMETGGRPKTPKAPELPSLTQVNEAEALRWPWNRKFQVDEMAALPRKQSRATV